MTTNTELPGWFLEAMSLVCYPPVETASNGKDGGHLPMTGKTAVRRRQEMAEATRQAQAVKCDAALHRALQWTRHWGG